MISAIEWQNSGNMDGDIYLLFGDCWYKKGDIIYTGSTELVISKYYRDNWINRLLNRIGFDIKIGYYKCKLRK